MKLGITSKLFLAISTSCIAIAVAMGAAVRVSFETGFVDYLGERNIDTVSQLEHALEKAYAQHGSWDFLTHERDAWPNFIINSHIALARSMPWAPGAQPDRPAGDMRPPDDAPGPPPSAGARVGAQTRALDAPPPDSSAGPRNDPDATSLPLADARSMPPFRVPGRFMPAMLFDAQKHRIAGNEPPPLPGMRLRPLSVAGQTVGWLSVASPENLFYAADRQFQVRQLRATWLIVGLAALLAAVVAIILARIFLAPIRRLVDATHRLASGDYETRVPEGSGDELDRLAKDFNQLAESLEQAERARRNFIADVSHELRTPLTVLRGELEAIEDGVRPLDRASLASLQSEVTMLSQLIDDLYELSLADIGALSFEKVPVDASGIVEAAADAFEERLNARRIALETDIAAKPAIILGDPHRLTQLLKNLLENALRYTDPGGKVLISVSIHAPQLHIDIQDSYPGVPELLLPHLFERLFRVDVSRSRQSGGAGLGLALCRHIAEAHEGTIEATHSRLGGLWIRLRLPLRPPQHD